MSWRDTRGPCYDMVRGGLISLRLFPQTNNPGVTETPIEPRLGDIRHHVQAVLPETVRVKKHRDRLEARGGGGAGPDHRVGVGPDHRVQCGPWVGSGDTKMTSVGQLVESRSSLESGE